MTVRIGSAALAALAALAAAAPACRGDVTGGSIEGPELFAKLCSACHGPDGRPPEAMALRLGVRDLTAPELRARITPALVEQQLRRGSENKLMPSFVGIASEAQIKALAEYVASPAFLRKP
ncbi:MAG TPA: c-type cytochrome [Kofleriaceae bacterium]|nr:c-type cytochrome [Kofleriaceae bacterium]